MTSAPDARVGVVCLGASAGGLRSLEAVLSRLPASFPWPILVSQHLQQDHASLMPSILSRVTTLTVREATDGEAPVPGVVYTCPSAAELGFSPEGRLTLRAPVPGRPRRIDHLFSTASFARPGLVIAVVLSGTGSDGTAGALVVKLNGGTVIAESDESAQETAMPRAAVKAGTVDATRTADAMAPLLVSLAGGGMEETSQETRRDVNEVARTLAAASGTDFTRYRFATLRRRIENRCVLVGVPTVRSYLDLVREDAAERDALVKSLLLPVTEFFRDPPAWDALAEEVLPGLVQRARSGGTIRIWCAGCASGEEAYTMAIALAERGAPPERVGILGTDLDPDSIGRAVEATYDLARMANVDEARRGRFFRPDADAFCVVDELRPSVGFRVHDLTRDPPPEGPFDIVVCRNVLIYFDEPLQAQVLAAFESCLAPRGVLFLGRSMALPSDAVGFEPIQRTMRIFRSRRTTGASLPSGDATLLQASDASPPAGDAARRVDAVLVQDSSALVLVVDPSWRITLANQAAREATNAPLLGKRLLDAFPAWQDSPVRDALRAAMTTGRSVRIQGVLAPTGFLDLTVEALHEAGERRLFLVAHPSALRPTATGNDSTDQALLREDLAATNDELQTANEELAAANEELQATNEELASLNEEFLSTNQNLASTNAEMSARAEHVEPVDELLHAILRSRGAVVACDAARRVTLVTPRAASLLRLDADVLGAPLEAGALGLEPATLDAWLETAARSDAPIERQAPTSAGGLLVTIEAFSGADGTALGWLLMWAPLER